VTLSQLKRSARASDPIAFIDLAAQRRRLGERIDKAIARVLAHNQFVLGPEVRALEQALGERCGARHVVTCANGTDALALVLLAKEIGEGDAIFCPSFTFAATAEVVAWYGATPFFVDVHSDTFNIDPDSLAQAIGDAKHRGLKPTAVIPVDLFGQPADYAEIESLCARHGLWMLSDAAQSFGASYRGRKIGTIGLATATSFFPSKPLGCYGDGGAIFTDDDELADTLRSVRVHGEGVDKYDNVRVGMNARLDTIQAAVLLEKLAIFDDEIARRDAIAMRYSAGLADVAAVPRLRDGNTSVWAQYTIGIDAGRRDTFAEALRAQGIPTAIYYRKPLHQQPAYKHYPSAGNGLPVSEALAGEVISLPMHPYLPPDVQDRIIEAARAALA
jgi:dTDP-4-amino-4,6-dideoxygalactose transaminase